MRLRHLVLMPLLLAIAACSTTSEPYPYPPHYLGNADVPPTSIPAPPHQGSAEYEREVAHIVKIQAALTPKQIAQIKDQITIRPEVLVRTVLSAHYDAQRYPKLYAMLQYVASDSWRIGDTARVYWKSPRPWYAEPRVKRYVEEIRSPGYPSGHTTTFGSWAYVLGDLFPAKRAALLEFAWSVGNNRIAGGAHYPHDIEGGKKLAAVIHADLLKRTDFQHDLEEVRDEIAWNAMPLRHAKPPGQARTYLRPQLAF